MDCINLQRCGHDGFDGVHTVFRFVEDDGLAALEDLIRDLHRVKSVFLADLFADGGVQIVERGQAVHEAALRPGLRHELCVDLIGEQVVNSRLPDLVRFSHRDPHVGIDHIRVLNRVHRLCVEFQHRAGLRGDRFARFDQSLIREVRLRRTGDKVHPHLCAADHQGVAHVVPRVAHVHELFAGQIAEMLLDRQEIGQNLRGVKFVRQSVPDGDARVFCQLLDDLLPVAAVFNAVVHAAEHTRGVGDRFFLPICEPDGSR